MCLRSRALPHGLTLAIGLLVGWTLAATRPAHGRADLGVAAGEDLITAGPISIEYNEALKSPVPRDAIYYLDYRGGRLLATIPSPLQSGNVKRVIDSFAERDLVADFKLAAGSSSPHFMMTTGTMGALNGAWAPLFVFETNSKQVATYKLVPQTIGNTSKPLFELLEIRAMPHPLATLPGGGRG
jgi:hypothetical protein